MSLSDYSYLFVHGYCGSSKTDWFPNIAELLKAKNLNFRIPDFPRGFLNYYPNEEIWEKIIDQELNNMTPPIILVGYSLGTLVLLKYIESHDRQFPMLLLISSIDNDPKLATQRFGIGYSFLKDKIDTNKVRGKVNKITLIHSTNDKSAPYSWGDRLSKELGANLVTLEGKGHLNAPECANDIFSVLNNEISLL